MNQVLTTLAAAVFAAGFGDAQAADPAATPLATGISAAPTLSVAAHTGVLSAREQTVADLGGQVEHRTETWVGKDLYSMLKLNLGEKGYQEVAVDAAGQVLSAAAVRTKYRAQFDGYGKIHSTLYQRLKDGDGSAHEVMVWLAVRPPEVAPKPEELERGEEDRVLTAVEERHRANVAQFRVRKEEAMAKLGLWDSADFAEGPFLVAKLEPQAIDELARSELVSMLMLHDPEGREDLATAMAIAGADDVQAAGISGNGVRVAVFESRPANTANLNIVDSYSAFAGITPSTSSHAQHVSAIINNSNAVSGFAPDTSFYSADSSAIAAFNWAVDNARASAINQSFHRAAEIGDGLQADDLYKDYKILHYPWPTVVQAAGNWCPLGSTCYEGGSDVTDEFVNHKGFNSISIGNHNDDATEMSASSCFINPSSPHGDRELPELAANGTQVTADGLTMSGTSMASPAVTGSVALLQQTNSTLRIWPEAVRALLFAGSTRNVASHAGQLAGGGDAADAPNTWWRDVSLGNDGFDGAGALNIDRSVLIARNRIGASPAPRGWDIGRMTAASFDGRGYFTRTYQVPVSPLAISRPHVKVALAWNSTATQTATSPSAIYASELELDLDLRVYDSAGNQVAYSLSWDNSYEIVDFTAQPGETYTIKVHRWGSSPAGAWSWFGIAWDTTWSLRLIPVDRAVLTTIR